MKKKIILRALLGFPLGMAIGEAITILFALATGQSAYHPCIPQLVDMMGTEVYAVALQALLCGVLGTTFSAASVIWQMDHWSITKQTGIYFLVTAVAMCAVAYVTGWMEHSLLGVVWYMGIFTAIFVVVWLVQYTIAKRNIQKINRTLQQKQHGA